MAYKPNPALPLNAPFEDRVLLALLYRMVVDASIEGRIPAKLRNAHAFALAAKIADGPGR